MNWSVPVLSLMLVAGVLPATAWPHRAAPNHREALVLSDTLPGRVVQGTHEHGGLRRAWRLYLPQSRRNDTAPALLVMLHGCTQDAADLVRGTRVEAHAERAGLLVLVPEQPASAHPQKCWNWYDPRHQARGGGEVALLSSLITEVMSAYGVDAARVHLAGISAGGAMAQLLATAYPEQFASLTVASGVPVGAASTVPDALAAMRNGPRPGSASSAVVMARMGERARVIPLLVMHGAADQVVSASNADALVAQWSGVLDALKVARPRQRLIGDQGTPGKWLEVTGQCDRADRALLLDWRVRGLGHAWSGGDAAGSYTDPEGPDATAALLAFIAEQDAALIKSRTP